MAKSLKFFSILTAFALTLSLLSGCVSKPSGEITEMREGFTAKTAADEMGIGINLGNTFDSHYSSEDNLCAFSQVVGEGKPSDYETCWGAVVTTREMIDGMSEAGFGTVRVPVYWGNGMENDGSFTVNKAYIERVEEVVRWVLKDGMYCVVNMHHYDERLITHLPREEVVAAVKTVWTQVAEHFKDYGDHLIFEGFNEYLGAVKEGEQATDQEKFDYCNELNQTFVDAVRSTGGNNAERVLIASGYNTNIDKTTSPGFIMPTDSVKDRLMVSVHYIDNNMYWSKQIGSETWHQYAVSQCELLKNRFTAEGIPVFVGETTGGYVGNMASDRVYGNSQECVRELVRLANEDYGFITVFWDTHNPDGSSFYDRNGCTIPDPINAETVRMYGGK